MIFDVNHRGNGAFSSGNRNPTEDPTSRAAKVTCFTCGLRPASPGNRNIIKVWRLKCRKRRDLEWLRRHIVYGGRLLCSFRRKSRAGWYRIARKTAHTAGPHACGLARVTGLWCGSAFIPLTGRLPRSLPRLLAASWRHAFLRSPARRCPACRSQLLRCADRPVSAGG